MDNVKEAIENRGSTLKEIEHSALFLDRKALRTFFFIFSTFFLRFSTFFIFISRFITYMLSSAGPALNRLGSDSSGGGVEIESGGLPLTLLTLTSAVDFLN